MKKIFITLALVFLCISRAYSEGYNVLVIPKSYLGVSSACPPYSVNMEEILSQKIIKCLEEKGTAYAPVLDVLKLSIKNNPNFIPDASNPVYSAKIISKAYGVPKVILISSEFAADDTSSQKYFWNKLGLPAVISSENGSRTVTTVTFIDTRSGDVLWQNIFYKNINVSTEQISSQNPDKSSSDIAAIYCDKLAREVIESIRESKETYAVRVTDNNSVPVNTSKFDGLHLSVFPRKKPVSKSENKSMHRHIAFQETFINKFKNMLQVKSDGFMQDFNSFKSKIIGSKQNIVQNKNLNKIEKAAAAGNTNKTKKRYLSAETANTIKSRMNVPKNDVYSESGYIFRSENYLINRRSNSRDFTLKFETFVNDM